MRIKPLSASRVRRVTIEGREAVLLPLNGKHALHRRLLLDHDVYDTLRLRYENGLTLYRDFEP